MTLGHLCLSKDCFVTNLVTVDTSLKIWPMKMNQVVFICMPVCCYG